MNSEQSFEASEVLFIGTDEAGYGPNLGPLLVGASAWRARLPEIARISLDAFRPSDGSSPSPTAPCRSRKKAARTSAPTLFDALEPASEPVDADRVAQDAIDRLNASLAPISDRKGVFPLVDSKKLYGASKSLAALERPFRLALALSGPDARPEATFRTTLARVAREEDDPENEPPWERGVDFPLPVDPRSGSLDALEESRAVATALFRSAGLELLDVAARRVQPLEFNRALDRLGLKSDVDADATLSLLVETLRRATLGATEPRFAIALCDKLGGRDRYAAALAERFDGAEIRVVRETREVGIYRVVAARARDRSGALLAFDAPLALEIRFSAKGESNAPTALASIVAKYLRELSMRPFNEYWRREVGETLAPTAGYPVDAARFRTEVDAARTRLGVADDVFWRAK